MIEQKYKDAFREGWNAAIGEIIKLGTSSDGGSEFIAVGDIGALKKEVVAAPDAITQTTPDVPEVKPTRKLIPFEERSLRNAVRQLIYDTFDDEAVTVANILFTVRHYDSGKR
jgi:hypothetical protein